MALWQFDLSLFSLGGPMPWLTGDGYEVPAVGPDKAAQAQAWLLARFGKPYAVFEDFFIYGSDQGNRVDLLFDEGGCAEVFARLDARESATSFIRELCELARLLDCGFFSAEYGKTIEATPIAVCFSLERSRAAAYVRDPEKVLRDAGDGA